MKKLLIVLTLILFSTQVFSAEPDKNLHNKCIYPTVALFNTAENGCGSGVVLRSEARGDGSWVNVVLTCAHIFYPPAKPEEEIKEKLSDLQFVIVLPKYKDWSTLDFVTVHQCVVYEMSREHDMAIVLFITDRPLPVATMSFDKKIYLGTDALRVGYGLGAEVRIDFGKITALNCRMPTERHPSIRTSIYTVPGDSGGPVFVDYEVVGIMQFLRADTSSGKEYNHMSHYIPIAYLKKWDESINKEISFVYDPTKPMPVLALEILKIKHWRTHNRIIPITWWAK